MRLSLLPWATLALGASAATASLVGRQRFGSGDDDSSDDDTTTYTRSNYPFSTISHSTSGGQASNSQSSSAASTTATSSNSTSATSTASASSASSSIFGDLTGLKGDTACSSSMCVSAVVNGSTVEYVLQSTSSNTPGWMAMGFGTAMNNAQMVVMWANSDGSITLSQRTAPGETMPTVDSSPDRVATSLSSLSSVNGASSYYGFSVPADSSTNQNIIWAFGSRNPGSSDPSAPFQQHDSEGVLSLNLSKDFATASNDPNSGSNTVSLPYTSIQKKVIAHAVLCGVGFLIFLPFGALLARWLRTFTPRWFLGHSIIQFYLSGTLIIIGFALGVSAVSEAGSGHLNDTHRKWGVAIFVLYLVQCAIGALIHWVKPRNRAPGPKGRPPQNYFHAVFGLLILAFAFYQVHTGYKDEWPLVGRGEAPGGVNAAFIAWAVIMPLLYIAGLALLPRQFRQESGGPASNSPRPSHNRSRSRSIGASGGVQEGAMGYADAGASSHGHGDPDRDDIGLTQIGRANQRASMGGRWSNDKGMYETSHNIHVMPGRR